MLYELSVYEDVAPFLGLAPHSSVFMAYLSVSKTEARLTGFDDFRNMVDEIPFFKEVFPRDKDVSSMLIFPNGVKVIYGSDALHFIGTSLLCLSEGTLVKTDRGNVSVESLLHNDKVITPDGAKSFEKIVCTGEKECIEVSLDNGYKHVVSLEHLFLVKRGSSVIWTRAGELKLGDDVVSVLDSGNRELIRAIGDANESLLTM
jgi:intein/homing endonuclease